VTESSWQSPGRKDAMRKGRHEAQNRYIGDQAQKEFEKEQEKQNRR